MKKSLAALAAMAAAGTMGLGAAAVSQSAQSQVVAQHARAAAQGAVKTSGNRSVTSQQVASGYGFGQRSYGSRGWQRRSGPGWTQAHVQRMARKKRNQARNRKACR